MRIWLLRVLVILLSRLLMLAGVLRLRLVVLLVILRYIVDGAGRCRFRLLCWFVILFVMVLILTWLNRSLRRLLLIRLLRFL